VSHACRDDLQVSTEGHSATPVFDDVLQESLLATSTAAAMGSTMAAEDATEVLLQLRIDAMLPLMSTQEVQHSLVSC
jgi:hypothetical protein